MLTVLLNDRSTIVLGSAITAFNHICPNRNDLIHPIYRKLCHSLIDTDEWGQIMIMMVLLQYAKGEFTKPSEDNVLVQITQRNSIVSKKTKNKKYYANA